jgi:hypothetical protein
MTATRPLRSAYSSGVEAGEIEGADDARSLVDAGEPAANGAGRVLPESDELGAVIDDFMRAAETGEAEDPYGEPYTPEGLRELHSALSHVKAELGTMRIQLVRRWHIQGMLDELRLTGLGPVRLTAVVEALHSLYSYAIRRGLVEDSPVIWLTFPKKADGLREPAPQGRPRFAEPPAEAPSAPPMASPPPSPAASPTATPTSTQAMLALGSRVLLWTVRAVVTIFVLVAIVLIVQFA